MATATHPSFAELFLRSDNHLGLCVVTVLSWIACSDGRISDDESAMLDQIASTGQNQDDLREAICVAQHGHPEDLQLALEVCRYLAGDAKETFLEMAIGMAVADGALAVGENHILRLIADLLGHSADSLNRIFRNYTGKLLPQPGDPSSIEWWDQREERWKPRSEQSRTASNDEADQGASDYRDKRVGPMSQTQALSILGLEDSATETEIRKAYRHLAKSHHPDRFSRMGPEAQKAAEVIFIRVRQAYETAIRT